MTYYESAAAAPPLARSTRRPSAEFDEFVLRYARAQRANVGLVFVGLGLAIGAAIRLDGGLMVAFAAVGLGIAGAGGGGFLMLYCPPERQEHLRRQLSHLRELPFNLGQDGSKVIFDYQR